VERGVQWSLLEIGWRAGGVAELEVVNLADQCLEKGGARGNARFHGGPHGQPLTAPLREGPLCVHAELPA